MKSIKRVIAALFTVCLLAASFLNVEASVTGTLKNAGANGFAAGFQTGAHPAPGLSAAGTSEKEAAKKAGTGDSAEKEKESTAKKTGTGDSAEKGKESTEKKAGEGAEQKTGEKAKKTEKSSETKTGEKTEKKTEKKTEEKSSETKTGEKAEKKTEEKSSETKTGEKTEKKAAEKASETKTGEKTEKKAAEKASETKTGEKAEKKTEEKTAEEKTAKKADEKETAAAAIEKAKNAAVNALSTRLSGTRDCVYVYRDYGLTKNHFTQKSKIYGSDYSLVKDMDENCGKKPYSGTTCIRCEQTAHKKDWGGWMFLNGYLEKWDGTPKPNDGKKGGAGLDLTGADALRFYARGKSGGEVVEFFTCGFGYDEKNKKTVKNPDSSTRRSTGQVKLTKDWKEYVIPLDGADLSYVVCGFGYELGGETNGNKDIVFYLDEIRFTGQIHSAQTAPVLLRSSDADDRKLKNTAFTEDNALAALAFLSEGKKEEAKEILDAFVYAIQNDRAYDSEESKNGPRRARNAYAAGDISAFPGWNSGTRMSGWYEEESEWYQDDSGIWHERNSVEWHEDRHQVGSSTGSNSFIALALLHYYNNYGDETYLETARSLMDWVIKKCYDEAIGFTEGFDGWKESDTLDTYPLTSRPTKDNIIAYAAFLRLYDATAEEKYFEAAQHACRFIEEMYNDGKGRFRTGTLEDGFTPDTAIIALDVQSLSALALWDSFEPYLDTLDTIKSMKVKKGGYPYNRYNKNGGWWSEGTAFTALMYRVFGKEARYEEAMSALVKIQNKNGLFPAATVDNFYTGLKLYDDTSLKLTKDTHIAPAAWFIMAANGYNPFAPHGAQNAAETDQQP